MRTPLRTDRDYVRVHRLLQQQSLHTVCEDAMCPNRHRCWNDGTATFMILGNVCTRNCLFCAVGKGIPSAPEEDEPVRIAAAVRQMKLKHVVITSVTRDDLPDGGAGHFAGVVQALRGLDGVTTEVLVPDFGGNPQAVETVLAAGPDVFNHNLETVRRLQPVIRPMASCEKSLGVLRAASARRAALIKSGLMLGLGETHEEVLQAMDDLLKAGCELLTMGQYLAPSAAHYPVARFLAPDEFDQLGQTALEKGFRAVASGPLVRSSFRAASLLAAAKGDA